MTSSNYDDTEERVTGGRNGFGAKLTNIYSKLFKVEVVEGGKCYKQEWQNNMSSHTEPQISQYSGSRSANYIKVSFVPDYSRFKILDLEPEQVALLSRRVYDVAGCAENL
jgi:DNA topoisomerase-2